VEPEKKSNLEGVRAVGALKFKRKDLNLSPRENVKLSLERPILCMRDQFRAYSIVQDV